MKPGTLRNRFTIQQATETRDSYGAVTQTWADLMTVWGMIEPGSNSESVASQQTVNHGSSRITIRYRTGITPKMRLKFGERTFNINGITNRGERNIELTLDCREAVL